jgi:hypothetical protein
MQNAAQSLLQLMGGKGYQLDHIAGRALIDSRPFQIFEGSNDVLYQQITEAVLKQLRRADTNNLRAFLADHEMTQRATDYLQDTLDFSVDPKMSQRKRVELGRAIGRVVTMEFIIEMGDRGFRSDLISNALSVFQQKVEGLVASYRNHREAAIVDDYVEGSAWTDFVQPAAS